MLDKHIFSFYKILKVFLPNVKLGSNSWMIVKTVFNDMFFYKLESQSNTNMTSCFVFIQILYLYETLQLSILVIRCNHYRYLLSIRVIVFIFKCYSQISL